MQNIPQDRILETAEPLTHKSRLPIGVIFIKMDYVEEDPKDENNFSEGILVRFDGQDLIIKDLKSKGRKVYCERQSLIDDGGFGLIFKGEIFYQYIVDRNWLITDYDSLNPSHNNRLMRFNSMFYSLFKS